MMGTEIGNQNRKAYEVRLEYIFQISLYACSFLLRQHYELQLGK